jgi:hypothetical protein
VASAAASQQSARPPRSVSPGCDTPDMYDGDVRRRALVLIQEGRSLRSISMSTGISRSTLRDWRNHPEKRKRHAACSRCAEQPWLPEPAREYAYLLGLYLGDGYINPVGDRRKGVWILRITCADAWPGLQEECKSALQAVHPGKKVSTLQREGCTDLLAWSRHWPCLFPQHGPGKKHERKIELAPWQQIIADTQPAALARGLFHSDGCRFVNRVRRPLADGDRWYEYPRYMFTNESTDILQLCGEALDLLGVSWRFSRRNAISVARREAVARLDEFVGPKY